MPRQKVRRVVANDSAYHLAYSIALYSQLSSVIVFHIHCIIRYNLYLTNLVRISVLEVILAVGSSGDQSYGSGNRAAEYFYPNANRWKSAGKYPGVGAVYMSPVLYVENMFIMFGGVHEPSINSKSKGQVQVIPSQPSPSNFVMKLDEGTKKWTKLGLLNQERSSDEDQVQRYCQ